MGRKRPICEIQYHFLVFTVHFLIRRVGLVFVIRASTDGSTILRHVLDRASKIEKAFTINLDPDAALQTLSSPAPTPRAEGLRALLAGLLSLLPTNIIGPVALSEQWLQTIKKRSERAARKANWSPEAVSSDSVALPSPPAKPPWHPKLFPGMAVLGSIAAAGILAGINWKRLGKPEWVWPTIVLSLAELFAILFFLFSLPEDMPAGVFFVIGVVTNSLFAVVLTYLQTRAYQQWVATYGQCATDQSGFLIPFVIIGAAAFLFLLFFIIIGPE
jgi:hypothetical protein